MGQSLLSYELCNDQKGIDDQMSGLELSLSAMACYPFPICQFWRILHGGGSNMSRNSSTSSLNSLPRLQFRDHIWTYTQRHLAAEAVEEAAAAIIGSEDGKSEEAEGAGEGMRLVQLLISCAEAVACRDKSYASVLLSELRASALVFGSSFQCMASCFVQGLANRMALVQPLGFVAPSMSMLDIASAKKEEALHLVYEICPHIQFGHFVSNSTILEAFEGENNVHVVDLGCPQVYHMDTNGNG
ncbi:DELLA protein SLN1 [Camellia lanceoleosa]|uniref:DELLA protein SLN1 n=1 Tax=Camellia lanceoleosa TaxID=1840588 RepID=A0ACC0HYM1_9ERIC|nr:DELLA protein SLN1 [Camellia lanceoleosa]